MLKPKDLHLVTVRDGKRIFSVAGTKKEMTLYYETNKKKYEYIELSRFSVKLQKWVILDWECN